MVVELAPQVFLAMRVLHVSARQRVSDTTSETVAPEAAAREEPVHTFLENAAQSLLEILDSARAFQC